MQELSTFVVGSLLTGLGASYTVKYFDCVNWVAKTTYPHTTACNHQTNKGDFKSETYTILQHKLTQRLKGYSCPSYAVPSSIIVVHIHIQRWPNHQKYKFLSRSRERIVGDWRIN